MGVEDQARRALKPYWLSNWSLSARTAAGWQARMQVVACHFMLSFRCLFTRSTNLESDRKTAAAKLLASRVSPQLYKALSIQWWSHTSARACSGQETR